MPIVGRGDWRTMPWRNGRGISHELWREPSPGDPGGFAVRVAVAEMAESGPFSRYPGVDRALVVLDGEGITLRRADGLVAGVRPLAPFAFHGEDEWSCELRGPSPVADLNVMVDRALRRAVVLPLRLGPTPVPISGHPDQPGMNLVFVVSGSASCEATTLQPRDLLVTEDDAELSAAEGATVLLVRVEPA